MANETLGASFSIDVTNLKAGLSQANSLIRESESEFKAAAASMDDWTESQEGLEARMKHLNTTADLQNKKVEALQSEYNKLISDGLDPTSAAAVKLRTDINKEKEALAKTEKEISKQSKALADLGDDAEDAGGEMEELGEAAEEASDGFTVADGAIATFIGNGLSSLVGAAKDAVGSLLDLSESTREYRTVMASLDNSSKAAGYTVQETEKTFKQLNGVLGDTQGAATTTANLQAIGLEQSKLQSLTDGVIGAWARYGDSIPIDGLAEAVNHTVQLGSVQGNLADVIEWGGGNVDEFNEKLAGCSTEAERAALIQQMLADQGLTESGKAWQENNQSIIDANNAQAQLDESTAKLGETIEPLTTKLTELKANGIQWIIETGLPALQNGFTWLQDNIPGLAILVGTFTAAWLTFGGAQKIVDGWNKVMAISQKALNAVMNANPIGLVITAITALVAAFVLLWNNCEGFRNFWIGLWEGIKTAAKAVGDWFVSTFSAIGQFFSDTWKNLGDGAKKAWQGIKDTFSKVADFFKNIFSTAWEGVKNVFSKGGKVFDGIKDGIVSAFKTVVNALITGINKVVKLPFEGLNGILDTISGLSIAGIKPFSWLTWRAPVPQLPELAEGGVVNKATTAVVGEDGAEAIIPLERNKNWLKQLAKEIAAEQGNGVTIHQTNNFKQAYESPIEKYKSKQQLFAAARLIKAGAY